MVCKTCGADMRIISSQRISTDGKEYRVLTHKCQNPRCSSKCTEETRHEIKKVKLP
ncbi:MAG: ogr/Delta-like zinc finger family protein [Clostridia bacterium]|nr:ogr/Delta-like zinc finger family protein [Clostridia bacterium]